VGKYTTEKEIDRAAGIIADAVNRLSPSGKDQPGESIQSPDSIRLTKYTKGLGCACKLRPQELEKVLKEMPVSSDPRVLIDASHSDDAAVFRISETTALVQTVDFFTPIVDSPYDFGAIAAANALSDIYAMGAKPLFALNIVGFPPGRLPMSVLEDILRGANDKAKEAGISILGGHTIDDPEPKYGMVVTGTVHPDKILANSTAGEREAIILTKPIGTGIMTTALKRGLIDHKTNTEVIRSMSELNQKAAEIIGKYSPGACTDVTGFGLIGHMSEISAASGLDMELIADRVPVFEEVMGFAAAGVIPGGSTNNLDYFSKYVTWENGISALTRIILNDAQTSGGLLCTVPENEKDALIEELQGAGIRSAAHIGNCLKKGKGKIHVKK
jgi:selenium donor protein